MMKKRIALAAALFVLGGALTGCSFVTVVPIGQEGEFTGEKKFDSSEESKGDWDQVVAEITEKAEDIAEVLNGAGVATQAAAVKGTAKITTYDGEKSKKYLVLEIDGYTGEAPVLLQVGGPNSTTALRDMQTLKGFGDFTNQTEWSQYAKSLNKESVSNVAEPLGLDASCEGKTVTFTGAAAKSGTSSDIIITPVSLEVE
jgi:predicted lipoprotein